MFFKVNVHLEQPDLWQKKVQIKATTAPNPHHFILTEEFDLVVNPDPCYRRKVYYNTQMPSSGETDKYRDYTWLNGAPFLHIVRKAY